VSRGLVDIGGVVVYSRYSCGGRAGRVHGCECRRVVRDLMFGPVDVVDIAPASPVVATTAEDRGRVVMIVVIVSRVHVDAWFQGGHI
jgi:hypothetical protein